MKPKKQIRRKIMICSAGLPGSGKGVVEEAAKKMSIPVVVMGDIVRRETEKRGLEPSSKNTSKLMLEYRERFGRDVFAKMTIREVNKLNCSLVLVDGVRNIEELEYFRKMGWKTFVIAVLASQKERYRRLVERGRIDDVQSYEEFARRDERELRVGLGRVLLYADRFLVNEGKTRGKAVEEASKIIKEILERVNLEKKS